MLVTIWGQLNQRQTQSPLFAYESLAGPADEARRERLETNARKLYMAMTRAGQQLFVVSSQRLPAGMQSLFDNA